MVVNKKMVELDESNGDAKVDEIVNKIRSFIDEIAVLYENSTIFWIQLPENYKHLNGPRYKNSWETINR